MKKHTVTYSNPNVNPFKTLPKDAPMRDNKGGQHNQSNTGGYNNRTGQNNNFRGRGTGYTSNRGNMNNLGGGNGGFNRNFSGPSMGGMTGGYQPAMGGFQPGQMGNQFGGFNRGGMMSGMRGGPSSMRGGRGGMGNGMMGGMPMGGMPMGGMAGAMGGMATPMGMGQMGGGMPGMTNSHLILHYKHLPASKLTRSASRWRLSRLTTPFQPSLFPTKSARWWRLAKPTWCETT